MKSPADDLSDRIGTFGPPTPMRRGSFTERYQKCGKKACPCHQDVDARHGPYFSLTRTVGGRTKTVHVPGEEADVVRMQVDAGKEFRQRLEAYWKECERCADEEMAGLRASVEEAEKGGSRRPSKRRSKPK